MRIIRLLWKTIVVAIITASLAINVIMFTWSAGALAVSTAFTAVTGVSSVVGKVSAESTAIKKKVSKASSRMAKRIERRLLRNVATTPTKWVPFAGIAVVSVLTALAVHDACQTLKELNELNIAIGNEPPAKEAEQKICGLKIPSIEDLKGKFGKKEEESPEKPKDDLTDSEDRPSLWDSLKENVSKFWGGDESPETSG